MFSLACKSLTVGLALAILVLLVGGGRAPVGWAQTDCTLTVQPGQSIQQAINAAAEGAVICLSAGAFQENIEIQKSLTLRGAGREQTSLEGKPECKPVIRIESDAKIQVMLQGLNVAEAKALFCEAHGIQVRGKAKVTLMNTQVSIKQNGHSLIVEDQAEVSLADSIIFGNRATGGVLVKDSAELSLNNSRISDNFAALLAQNSAQLSLINSRISGNLGDGVSVEDSVKVSINDSVFKDNSGCGIDIRSAKVQARAMS